MSESAPVTMYVVGRYDVSITPVRVMKATDHFVTVEEVWHGKKQSRRRSRDGVYETWEAAHAAMLFAAERAAQYAADELSRRRNRVADIKAMVPA